MREGDCIFSSIVAGEAPAHVVYDDDATVAFMDINPATEGHVLVVPRRHSDDLWDLPADDGEAVWRATHRLARAARDAFRPDGLNLVKATRSAAFQSVFHFHVHVIPRYVGDGIQPPWIERPGNRDPIAAAAGRLKAAL